MNASQIFIDETGWHRLTKIRSLAQNSRQTAIQSCGVLGTTFYALYDYETQVYGNIGCLGMFASTLHHPNDCECYKGAFLICDTGTKDVSTMLRVYDPQKRCVLDSFDLAQQGWRTAAATYSTELGVVTVSVQAIDSHMRTENLISFVDWERRHVEPIMTFPMRNRFVQGCTFYKGLLFVTTNNGGLSETTRFIEVNLQSRSVVQEIVFHGFGESEGLFCHVHDEEEHLITCRNYEEGEVYELEVGRLV